MAAPDRTTISAEEAALVFGIGRRATYANFADLGGVRVGRFVRFPVGTVAAKLGLSPTDLLAFLAEKEKS